MALQRHDSEIASPVGMHVLALLCSLSEIGSPRYNLALSCAISPSSDHRQSSAAFANLLLVYRSRVPARRYPMASNPPSSKRCSTTLSDCRDVCPPLTARSFTERAQTLDSMKSFFLTRQAHFFLTREAGRFSWTFFGLFLDKRRRFFLTHQAKPSAALFLDFFLDTKHPLFPDCQLPLSQTHTDAQLILGCLEPCRCLSDCRDVCPPAPPPTARKK